MNLAYAYVDPQVAVQGQKLQCQVIGESYTSVVVPKGLYDPSNILVRS